MTGQLNAGCSMDDGMKQTSGYLGLKRVSAIGFGIVVVWISLSGGYMLLRLGNALGWAAIAFGALLLAAPLTGFFRNYWNVGASSSVLPAVVLLASVALIMLYGSIARIYITDPFLNYNDMNSLAALIFGVATGLSVLALLANVVALVTDRRATFNP